jgi:integrase
VRQFYLHQRSNIFYVQFVDQETKRCLPARSTGKNNRDEALVIVSQWLKEGIPQPQVKPIAKPVARPLAAELSTNQILAELKKADLSAADVMKIEKILKDKGLVNIIVRTDSTEAETLEDFLTRFWDYERSPYVEEKLSHKVNIGLTHTKHSLERVNRYWVPPFKDKMLGEITRQDIKDFSVELAKNNPTLSPLTLKQILRVGVTALRWAHANGLIPIDPTEELPAYSSKSRKRDVLSPEEALDLFRLQWRDERYKLVNMIAMTTGLRIGEILALKAEDIGDEYLSITKSYSIIDGLKSTKTDEVRTVPVVPQIRDAMRKLGMLNPHGDEFIFFGDKPNQPFDQHLPLKALKAMLIELRVGDTTDEGKLNDAKEYWKKRNVVFHSWRHFYAARMTDKLEARKVMLATGHKTAAVFDGYAGHSLASDLSDVAVTTAEVFGGILPPVAP